MTNVNTQKYLPLILALLGLVISPFIMRSLGLTPGTATDVVTGVTQGISTVASLSKYVIPIAALAFAYFAFQAYAPRRK